MHSFSSSFQITMKQNLHIRGTTLITIGSPLFLSSCLKKKKAILCCEVSQTREMLRPHLDFFFFITYHSSLNFRHSSLITHHSSLIIHYSKYPNFYTPPVWQIFSKFHHPIFCAFYGTHSS